MSMFFSCKMSLVTRGHTAPAMEQGQYGAVISLLDLGSHLSNGWRVWLASVLGFGVDKKAF